MPEDVILMVLAQGEAAAERGRGLRDMSRAEQRLAQTLARVGAPRIRVDEALPEPRLARPILEPREEERSTKGEKDERRFRPVSQRVGDGDGAAGQWHV